MQLQYDLMQSHSAIVQLIVQQLGKYVQKRLPSKLTAD